VASAAIDSFVVSIPLLAILSVPANARDAADAARLVTARQTRRVDVTLLVEIAATIHQLNVTLQPHF
jgi:hypothetical protein